MGCGRQQGAWFWGELYGRTLFLLFHWDQQQFTLGVKQSVTSSCQVLLKFQFWSHTTGSQLDVQILLRLPCSSPSCESGADSSCCFTRTGSCKQQPGNSSWAAMQLKVSYLRLKGDSIHTFFQLYFCSTLQGRATSGYYIIR